LEGENELKKLKNEKGERERERDYRNLRGETGGKKESRIKS
jgi:hypothetical protein